GALAKIITGMDAASDVLGEIESKLDGCALDAGVLFDLSLLHEGQVWLSDQASDLRKRKYLGDLLAGSDPSITTVSFDESIIPQMPDIPPGHVDGATAGKVLAEVLITHMASGGVTKFDWGAMAARMSDPAFAAALFNTMGAGRFADLVNSTYGDGRPGATQMSTLTGILGSASKYTPPFTIDNISTTALPMSKVIADFITSNITSNLTGPSNTRNYAPAYVSIISNGQFSTGCAVALTDWVYGADTAQQAGTSKMGWSFDQTIHGTVVPAVMGMLGKNPDAATSFFGDPSGEQLTVHLDADPNCDGTPVDVTVSAHIGWALNWSAGGNDGTEMGQALSAAGAPTSVGERTVAQADVASKILVAAAAIKQQDHGWAPSNGVSQGLAVILAQNMDDLVADTPKGDDPDKVVWVDSPVTGGAVIVDGVPHLGVNGAVFGTVLQAIGSNQDAVATVVTGWSNYLPIYLAAVLTTGDTPEDLQARINFYTVDNPAHWGGPAAMENAAAGLDLIIKNTSQGCAEAGVAAQPSKALQIASIVLDAAVGKIPGIGKVIGVGESAKSIYDVVTDQAGKAKAAAEKTDLDRYQGIDAVEYGAYSVYVGMLASAGYFTPEVLSGANITVGGPMDYSIWLWPPDVTNPVTAAWLTSLGVDEALEKLWDQKVDNPLSTARVVVLP
ncbi:MAG: hypothetical protein FWF36_09500, partial [Propionibacteriaceae bacterium]|nr:hypothetical protein [Propionibacteriaceae bacterium]